MESLSQSILSDSEFRSIIASSLDAFLVISKDGNIIEVNNSYCRLTGYSRHELIGLHLSEIDSIETIEDVANRANQTIQAGALRFETQHRHKNGVPIDVEVSTNYSPIHGGCFFSFIRDISDRKRAEESLSEKESYLRAIIDTTPECIKLLDRDGRLLMMNQAGLRMIEADSLEQVKGACVSMLVTDQYRTEFRIITEKVFAGEACNLEFEAIGLKGTPVWLDTHAVPLRNAQGEVSALLGVTRNITERKMSEEKLRLSEQKYSSFFRMMPDVAGITRVTDGSFIEVNDGFERWTGWKREEVIGRLSTELNIWSLEERNKALEQLKDQRYLEEFPFTMTTRSGAIRDALMYLTPINISGEDCLFFIARDITEWKQAENRLRLFMESVENSTDAIGMSTPNGIHYYQNRAFTELFGDIGDHPQTLYVDNQVAKDVFDAITSGKQWSGELMMYAKDRSIRDILLRAYAICDKHGDVISLVGIHTDISERKNNEEQRIALEKQLLHAQKLESLGVLAGGIAHDFNNLLMAIIGNVDLALLKLPKESPVVDNLHQVEKAAARAADLANQMLAYSGKGTFIIQSLDLNFLITEMLHMLLASISKKVVLRQDLTPDIPTVDADATQIQQILMNLVINASEAIGDKSGVIAIKTGCMECNRRYLNDVWLDENIAEGRYVYFEVSDTGCGMDKDTLDKIFDPFFSTKFTGRGLGMAAVLGIVRSHKGAIKVYSEPNKGTNFKVLLPAGSKPITIFNYDSEPETLKLNGTVLLVDDEETVRGIGTDLLREIGFAVLTACDGRDALDVLSKHPEIDLVLLDLTMPAMDGEQCFRELKQIRPELKVIMSSGYNEQEVIQKFVGKGLNGFIQKPYKLNVLRDVLSKVFMNEQNFT